SYERMLGVIVELLAGSVPPGGLVVDLGAGTGALSAAVLDALPEVRVQLVDVDPTMLEAAVARLEPHAGRFEARRARFDDELPRCHAVIATLALHHVADRDEKRRLYASIHRALEPGGLLAVGDLLVHPDGPERRRVFAAWYRHTESMGISREEADAHFAQWA